VPHSPGIGNYAAILFRGAGLARLTTRKAVTRERALITEAAGQALAEVRDAALDEGADRFHDRSIVAMFGRWQICPALVAVWH
jgi:hypothetical protein